MTIALMTVFTTTISAQEKKTIELPAWIQNVKLSGYGMVQYQGHDKENAHENPIAAKTDKSPQSRQNSGKQDTNTDKGTSKSDGKKPSVKEKLERYKAEHAAGQKKEAERYQPKHTQEKKTPSKNRQTKHKQPKKKQKAKHYKSKER